MLTLLGLAAGCGDNRPYDPDALPCEPVDDGNDCTNDVCDENGQPTSVDRGAGETCGGGVCDGNGNCVECLEDEDCGDGESCTEADNTCNPITCTDGKQNGDETDVDCGGSCAPSRRCGDTLGCNVANDCQSGVCSGPGGTCTAARCGDGVEQSGETCDDGNDTNGDGCDDGAGDACRPTGCGNGVVTAPEVCDDGNNVNGDGCDNNCTATACGNGVRAGTEACDDGDTMAGDGCSGTCTTEPGFMCNMATPNVCIGTCGDGIVVTGEACDDAPPAENGDGCSMTCTLEPGYNCTGSPSTCTTVCGDGVRVGTEGCDDGDTMAGDGCNSSCFVEPGWICAGTPSACFPICGDGIVRPGEACDDGDLMPGDGCRANCTVEPGYGCTGSPSLCSAICGDGLRVAPEVCDDGDLDNGDGCNNMCARENGWTCNMASPTVCTTTCGDGIPVGAETCDDGDLMGGDGCSGTCAVETGFACTGAPSACTPICGDNMVVPGEPCDDPAPAESGDGCSATCTVELGYNCQGSPSVCALTCGNGVLDSGETCDDGDLDPLDGCSTTCTQETGWTCMGTPSVCTSVCGDGVIAAGAEQCDDAPPAESGDGCSATCTIDVGYTCTGTPSVCVTTCGDGIPAGTETCDDGCNRGTPGVCEPIDNHDGCSATCGRECGDGLVNSAVEACDDGNLVGGDGCSATCELEVTCGAGETLVKVTSSDVPKPIVDNNPAGTDSNLVVPASHVGSIRKVVVGIGRADHTFTGDVVLSVLSPSGRRRTLVSRQGGGGDNWINTRFDDGAAVHVNAGTAPYTGNFRPLESLSDVVGYAGHSPAGTWQLRTADFAGGDFGTLFAWSIAICYVPGAADCGNGVTDAGEECDDGNLIDTDACSNACSIMDGCGDGNIDGGEACDDNNVVSGDGCSSTCAVDIGCAAGETPVVVSNFTPVPVPDLNAAGALSSVTVATTGEVTRVVPRIASITHAFDDDLDIFLVGPNNRERELSTDNFGVNYIGTYFDDAAVTAITAGPAPYTGRFRPEQSISSAAGTDFRGINAAGTWSLRVADDTMDDTGTIDGWTLTLCVASAGPYCGDGVTNGSEECDDGNTVDNDTCNNVCGINDGCGDGNIDGGEACDDNNFVSGDGCSSTCTVDITCAAGEIPVVVANNASLPITDNNAAGVLSPVTVAQAGAVTKVVPYIAGITHPRINDVDIFLVGASGVQRELSTDNGGTSANYRQTYLDDAATATVTSGSAPFIGRFRPEFSMSTTPGVDFRASNAAGTWNLKVADDLANMTGTLDGWTLALCVNPTAAYCGDSVVNGVDECDDGNTVDNDACNNSCQIMDGCGDGNLDLGEECDDNNRISGDGCSSSCVFDIACAFGETAVVVRNMSPLMVPDDVGGRDGLAFSTLAVPTAGVVRKVHAILNANHTLLADFDIYLVSPYGVQRSLAEDRTGTAFTSTVFADSAANTLAAGASPFSGSFRPTQTLSDSAGFFNQTAQGNWVLRVTDDTANNLGTVNSWGLALCVAPTSAPPCGNGFVEPGETCDDGNFASGDGCSVCQIELACGVGQTAVRVSALSQPRVILDNQPGAGAASPITVPDGGVVRQAVVVAAAVSHTTANHTTFTLTSPTGTNIDLSSGNGSTSDHFVSTMFDDSAATAITATGLPAPFRGRFRPEVPLSGVNGQAATGAWTMTVADTVNGDGGTFHSWSLGLCVE